MKKKYIILIMIVVLYLAISFILFYDKPTNKKLKKDTYILFSNNLWDYNGEKFTNKYLDLKVIGNHKFYIYENAVYKGKYNLGLYESDIYLFDDQNNSIPYEGELMGFTDKKDHLVAPLDNQVLNTEDETIIQQICNQYNISYPDVKKENIYKYSIDINQDGDNEQIYTMNNMFDEEKTGKGYALIFIYEHGKIYELMRDIQSNSKSLSDGYSYYINNIADLDGDQKLDFILSKTSYGSPELCYLLVQKEKREYKVTKSC